MHFSRKFTSNDSLIVLTNGDIYQATFIKAKVLHFLGTWIDADKIIIESFEIDDKPWLRFVAVKEGETGTLDADFPCPEQCVPPTSTKAFTDIAVEFDVSHVLHVASLPNSVFINVQLSKRNGNATDNPDSFAIYCITVEDGELIRKDDPNSNTLYISDPS